MVNLRNTYTVCGYKKEPITSYSVDKKKINPAKKNINNSSCSSIIVMEIRV